MTTSTLADAIAATPCTVATDLFLDSIDAALEETPFVYTERVALGDDSKTTVHVLRQELRNTVVQVADLGSAKRVTDVCTEAGGRVVAAMSGGFFAREAGCRWVSSGSAARRQSHVPFPAPWRDIRGSLLVDADGITIGRRDALPSRRTATCSRPDPCWSPTDGRTQAWRRTAKASARPPASSTATSPTAATRAPRSGTTTPTSTRSWSTAGRTATSACR
jgi:hypothetical protein